MSKYEWRKGVVKTTLPSRVNWMVSLWLLSLTYYSLFYSTFEMANALEVYQRIIEEKELFFWSIGIWFYFRGSLMTFRFGTAVAYLYFKFPRMRKSLEVFAPYDRLAILYTGYAKSEVEIFNALTAVYKAAYLYGAKKTILVMAMSKNEKGEREFPLLDKIRQHMVDQASTLEEADFYCGMELVAFAQDGTGKRAALVKSIVKVIKLGGADIYYLMDGDSAPEEEAFVKSIPFFQNYPRVGGITLENWAYVQGDLFYVLYSLLRFLRRRVDQAYACTVLTGRGSFIRGEILESRDAVTLLSSHYIPWGESVIKALTGDDKTMVYLVWAMGYETLFLPDVGLFAMEEPLPEAGSKTLVRLLKRVRLQEVCNSFLSFITQEFRYARNMLLVAVLLWRVRPNNLATTLKLFDQRFFFWAALVGPLSSVVASTVYGWSIFLFWIVSSLTLRIGLTLVQGVIYGYWHPLMPIISFINIIQGGIKLFSFRNIDKARWNRGGNEVGSYDWLSPVVLFLSLTTFLALVIK